MKHLFGILAAVFILGCADTPPQSDSLIAKQVKKPLAEKVKLFDVFKDCENCPPMVKVPPLQSDTASFYVARHELTWREYLFAVKEAGCGLPKVPPDVTYTRSNLDSLSDNYPVNYLLPSDFECYLSWINGVTGKKYRLPTSPEWGYLAKAGSTTRYPWGEKLGSGNAAIYNHYDRKKYPQNRRTDPRFQFGKNLGVLPVESFKPNAWGLYDVIGNVAEYVDERKEGASNCIEQFGKKACALVAYRGGNVGSVALRVGEGWVGQDEDHMNAIKWTYPGLPDAAQPHGYRIVRN
ncbi:formylglycine-generating enzyme family protein [Sphingorhabdus sp. EL138]|uniref:formylglycine-generating enzyme family protein n=1 Tax=Sphingorhabdus sp. EL138 TaxID=2073156 RepID=UPI0013A59B17|nr:formylglycine-generating enzyme family protein [Sphingorhabdus sp. EL138]